MNLYPIVKNDLIYGWIPDDNFEIIGYKDELKTIKEKFSDLESVKTKIKKMGYQIGKPFVFNMQSFELPDIDSAKFISGE